MGIKTGDTQTLWHYWGCPFCQRARVMLAEKQIDYKSVAIEMGADMPEAMVELNPEASVPTFEDGDLALYGSKVIIEYLDDRYPEPAMMSASPVEKARTRLAIYICDNGLGSALHTLHKAQQNDASDSDGASKAADEIQSRIRRLSGFLGERDYFRGATFGLADVGLASFILQLRDLNFPADKIPKNIRQWMERVAERPSVRAQILDHPGRN